MSKSISMEIPSPIGLEEESGMIIHSGGAPNMESRFDFFDSLELWVPEGMAFSADDQDKSVFIDNGFRVYADFAVDTSVDEKGDSFIDKHLEVCTPECQDAREATVYSRASERLRRVLAGNFLASITGGSDSLEIRFQRRVVDSSGATIGAHDNFDWPDARINDATRDAVVKYALSDGFIVGAGILGSDGNFSFKQKLSGKKGVYPPQILAKRPHIDRFELKCNDCNISDWATKSRVGMSALVFAMAKTPLLLTTAEKNKPFINQGSNEKFSVRRLNNVRPQRDGAIELNEQQIAAIDFQRSIAEAAMDKLPDFMDVSPAYHHIAYERLKFLDDLLGVNAGRKELAILTDRADWAAKLWYTLQAANRIEDATGQRLKLGDFRTRQLDLRYDYVSISATDGELHKVEEGYGYKLRKKGVFRDTVEEMDIARAFRQAPQTRAAARASILRSDFDGINAVTWDCIETDKGYYELHDPLNPEPPKIVEDY